MVLLYVINDVRQYPRIFAPRAIVHSSESWPFNKLRWPLYAGARGLLTFPTTDTCALLFEELPTTTDLFPGGQRCDGEVCSGNESVP